MSGIGAFVRISRIAYLWAVLTAAWLYYALGHVLFRLVELGGIDAAEVPAVAWATAADITWPPLAGLAAALPLGLLEFAIRRFWRSIAGPAH